MNQFAFYFQAAIVVRFETDIYVIVQFIAQVG
jgi:hypothetical protein